MRVTRLLITLASLTAVLVLVAPSADASRKWCRRDPVVVVAGKKVNIEVAIPEDRQSAVTDALKVVVYVPVGVNAKVVAVDEGFNGFGEEVMIVPSRRLRVTKKAVSISVEATLPASRNDVSVALIVTPDGARAVTANGRSNSALSVSVKVAAAP
jgi:hypothetical protein